MATTAPGLVRRLHVRPRDVSANPLLRALTGYVARKPGIACLGGAARARISPLTRLVCVGGRLADSAFVLVIGCAAPDP